MNTNPIAAIVALFLIALCFFLTGAIVGNRAGESSLCATQFKGEMHEGKCMLTTRVEITK
jgi:hypothetical protein